MNQNGVPAMIATTDAAAVLDAGRRRMRLLLIAALVALGAVATALVATPLTAPTQHGAPVCLVFGRGPVNNGKAVIAAGLAMEVPEEGIVAGLTAAMQETRLLNLANPHVPDSLTAANDGLAVDHDSLGILQQRSTWGSAAERMSPAAAAEKFFTAMRDVDGWDAMPAAELAAIVQRSAGPDAYADAAPAARQFYRDHLEEVRVSRCSAGNAATWAAVVGTHS